MKRWFSTKMRSRSEHACSATKIWTWPTSWMALADVLDEMGKPEEALHSAQHPLVADS